MVETITEINQLLKEVQTITQSYDRVAEATGENFNVFSILQMEHYEVETHSRFIAELLNPKGRHGQKNVFLDLFISSIINNIPKNTTEEAQGSSTNTTPFSFESATAEVIVEHYVGPVTNETGGRIDILIREKGNKGKVIMIENKIYAEEQPNQLLRYRNAYPDGELLFLTLDGKKSTQKVSEKIQYTPIAYKDNITEWLELCKKECASIPILRETIVQYINSIKKLTNQNLNKQMDGKIVTRIAQDIESYKSAIAISNALNTFKSNIIRDTMAILNEKSSRFFKCQVGNIWKKDNKNGIYIDFFNYKNYNFKLRIMTEQGVSIWLAPGINGKFGVANDVAILDLKQRFLNLKTSGKFRFQENGNYTGWIISQNDFTKFSDEQIIELFNSEDKVNKLTDAIVEEVKEFVTAFKNGGEEKIDFNF